MHDRVLLLVPEQHPNHGRLRNEGAHTRAYRLVARMIEYLLVKAGAVKIVYKLDPLLGCLGAERSGVHREVAALGVPAKHQRSVCAGRDALKILHRRQLRRNRTDERHVEVLFPADQRRVRAAESDKAPAVLKYVAQRGELRLRFKLNLVYIITDKHPAEALAFCRRLEKPYIVGAD